MVKPVKKPTVSKEEQKFRDELYPDVKIVKNKNILCTSCNRSLKELILKGKPKTHPFLDTLLCEKCNSFFGDGEFSVDEDGSDKYCRWCGQGGTLYLCSSCTAGFCKKCIKRNLPRAALNEVEDDDWQCFCCNVKPLYELRAHCWAANKFAAEYVKNEEGKRRRNKRYDDQDDAHTSESDDSSTPKKRQEVDDSDKGDDEEEEAEGEEEEAAVVSTRKSSRKGKKNQAEDNKSKPGKNKSREKSKIYKPVVTKLAATLKDAISMTDLFKKKALDCSHKKISLNYIKDTESVIQICGKVDSLLQSVESISNQLRTSVNDYLQDWRKEHVEFEDKEKESNDKMEEDSEDKKTVNGIEDEKKSEDEDKLGNDSKIKENASDENEHSKESMDQDEVGSPEASSENIPVEKSNGSDSDINDDKKTEDNDTHKREKSQEGDSNEGSDKKNESSEETSSKYKRVHDFSSEEDIPSKEETGSSKKMKLDEGDN